LERYILKAKWGGFGRTDGVFAGAKEEEETQAHHIPDRVVTRRGRGIGDGKSLRDDRNGDGFDTGGRRICFGVGAKLALKPEVKFVVGIKTGVRGPHAAERLRNSAYGVFHCARSDRTTAGL
jgi:rhodanese-related sulfurtransferase